MDKSLVKVPKDLQKTDFKKLPKKELVKIMEDFMLPFSNPDKYKALVESAMPEFVKKIEDKETAGTAIYESSQEMMLVIADVLKRHHNFSDAEIRTFHMHLTDILRGVEQLEEGGLSMLSAHSVSKFGDLVQKEGIESILKRIAETRYQKGCLWRNKLEAPNTLEGSKIERQLQKPRR